MATEILSCLFDRECIKHIAHNHSSDANVSDWHFKKIEQQFPIHDWKIFPYMVSQKQSVAEITPQSATSAEEIEGCDSGGSSTG